ncbi:non sense mediated decay [Hyphodiscus hymeniophilus]|uniref:Non sense mediated decay n=1 Tax=Hyphodiscus hymeniophilus TaxID=353542 RepID=A0A9P7AWC1_9HELO|nr:non sense mediated decay [Hyphodiscus hymeniophilus]
MTPKAAFITRSYWLPSLRARMPSVEIPGSSYLYSRLPATFAGDIEAGLSSSAFDLSGNVAGGDSRAGLDDASKKEIQKIMRNQRVGFDEARRIYIEGRFAKNGIAPDGRPRDPKFVSFS